MRTVSRQSPTPSSTGNPGVDHHDGTTADTRPLLHHVTGSGDPIVLMPGIITGWVSWKAHDEHLAERHTVIRAQVRCVEHVEAGVPIPPDYSIAMERDAMLATVNALELDRFDLVGWSLGGLIALAFTLEHPEYVRTLTLIEPAASWILRETSHALDALTEAEAFDRSFADRDITIDDLTGFLVRAGLGTPDTDFTVHPRWPVMVRNRQSLSVIGAVSDHTDSIERLRALDVPVLAVMGTDSAETDRAITSDIAANAPNATLLELPGDHACHLENSERFLKALEAHIARHTEGPKR